MSEGRQDYDDDAALAELYAASGEVAETEQDVPLPQLEDPDPPADEPVEEEAPAEEQESAPEEEKISYATAEDIGILRAQMELFQSNLARTLDQALKNVPQPQQQQAAPVKQQDPYADYPGYQDDPAFKYIERIQNENKQLAERIARQEQAQHQYAANQAWQQLEHGRNNLRQQFADFDQVIRQEEVEAMWRTQVNNRQYNAPFAQVMEREYKLRTWDRGRQASDDLSRRREEKVSKSASVAAAAKVPSGGASFQKVEHKPDPTRRGYDDAHSAAMADLEALGG